VQAAECFQKQDFAEAVKVYDKCLELDPHNKTYNCSIYLNRSMANQRNGDLDKALEDLDEAIRLNSSYIKAYIKRGDIQMQKEAWQEAVGDYETAKNLDHSRQFDTRQKL